MHITEPLRLAVGSHKAGSGRGCAMNVISWENGDTTITDLPGCADQVLARIVQRVNDTICAHRDGDLSVPAVLGPGVGVGAPDCRDRCGAVDRVGASAGVGAGGGGSGACGGAFGAGTVAGCGLGCHCSSRGLG